MVGSRNCAREGTSTAGVLNNAPRLESRLNFWALIRRIFCQTGRTYERLVWKQQTLNQIPFPFAKHHGQHSIHYWYIYRLPISQGTVLFPNLTCSTTNSSYQESLETKRHKKDIGLILGNQLTKFVRSIFHQRRGAQPYRHLSHSQDESSASLLHRPSTSSSHASPYPSKPTKPALPRPSMKEVFTRQSVINLIVYTFLALHNVAYDQLLPIFLHNPRQKPDSSNTHMPLKFSGGFGLNSDRIGTIFTLYGICGCFIQFLVFPPVAKRMGVLNCFKCCGITFPVVCFITPYTALIQNPTL